MTGQPREDLVVTGATSTGQGSTGKTGWGRRIAALPSGRRTKWAVLGFWLIVSLGISALFFKYVFGFAGADNSMPLFAFVFLVALGIDYNIFLMTRVREETVKAGTHRGMLAGLAATGGVITSAGLILAGTFATLGTLPLVILTEVGFTVALGVLLDTLLVRSVLVTALTLDVGRHIWWPSRLARPRAEEAVPPPAQLTRAR
jgi:putative drug exporter of the RND superfamily